jgi:Ca2+/Na+ antiporter
MRHMQASARTPTRVHDFGAPDPHAGHKHAPNLALPSPILNSSFREHPPALRLDEEKSMRSPVGTNGTHVSMVDVERGIVNNRREVHHPLPQTSAKFAFFALAVFTALAGVTAECLVDSIDGMTEATNVSREFIGLVVLPVSFFYIQQQETILPLYDFLLFFLFFSALEVTFTDDNRL